MARIRTIKPEFFRHEGLFESERSTGMPLRLAFAGLWTAADREGRFKWNPRQLKLDCLPYDDVDFSAVLQALEAGTFIVKYNVEGVSFGYIPGWPKHQVVNNREAASTIPSPDKKDALATRDARAVDDHVDRQSRDTHAKATPLGKDQGEGKGKEREGKEKDAADAAPTPEAQLFDRGKALLGATSGGIIKNLLKAKGGNIALARAAIEMASTKSNPREYIGAIVRGNHDPPANPNGALI